MFKLEIIPRKECDNEYATPCLFYFDNIYDLSTFLINLYKYGRDIVAKIEEYGME